MANRGGGGVVDTQTSKRVMTLDKVRWKKACEGMTVKFHKHPMFLWTTELTYLYFPVQDIKNVAVTTFPGNIVPRRNPCF